MLCRVTGKMYRSLKKKKSKTHKRWDVKWVVACVKQTLIKMFLRKSLPVRARETL